MSRKAQVHRAHSKRFAPAERAGKSRQRQECGSALGALRAYRFRRIGAMNLETGQARVSARRLDVSPDGDGSRLGFLESLLEVLQLGLARLLPGPTGNHFLLEGHGFLVP